MTRIVYMGTPALSVYPLRALYEKGYDIVTVVTQPDRPAGRSRHPKPSPVKRFALEYDLPLYQPQTLRTAKAVEHLCSLTPDIIIVAAFGQILQPAVLSLPPYGCLNVHLSLLPRHRGASPVAATILSGDSQAGVTLMQMDQGMDTGPIIAQKNLPLTGQEHRGELSRQLTELGSQLLLQVLPQWLAGKIVPQPQDHNKATYSRILRKKDGEINWSEPATFIDRSVRAYHPWPGTYTKLRGRRLRIWKASLGSGRIGADPGTIRLENDQFQVATGEGLLVLEEVQLAGKRRLKASAFLRGQRGLDGLPLG